MRKAPKNCCERDQAWQRHGRIAVPRTVDVGFTTINEGFTCEACGANVPPAISTCRNHCTSCLVSKHVDDSIPGDRSSTCKNLMNAVAVEGSDPEKLDLVHQCTSCGKIQRNKVAKDDDRDAIFGLMAR